jgi:ABC-type glutathione transport system ATPase component
MRNVAAHYDNPKIAEEHHLILSDRSSGAGVAASVRTVGVAVRLQSVTRVYGKGGNAVAALRDVSIAFPRASFTAVMGPSGSGKSTLLRCAAGLDRPGPWRPCSVSSKTTKQNRHRRLGGGPTRSTWQGGFRIVTLAIEAEGFAKHGKDEA